MSPAPKGQRTRQNPNRIERISIDPKICHGEACIKGTCIPVHQILHMLANGDTIDDPALNGVPSLSVLDKILTIFETLWYINNIVKSLIVTILLSGVLIMNTAMFCQSLCIAGHHNDKTHGHASHHNKINNMANHEMPQGEDCPIIPHIGHGKSKGTAHTMPQTFMKCGCSIEDDAFVAYEAALIKPLENLAPHLQIISIVEPYNISYSSREPVPLEGPPKILS